MSRRANEIPSYRCKKVHSNGRTLKYAIVSLSDGFGGRKDIILGPWNSKESKQKYTEVLTQWQAAGKTFQGPQTGNQDLTVNELVERYRAFAEGYYSQPGNRGGELEKIRLSLRPLRLLFGDTLGKDFGPLKLKAVRQAMLTGAYLDAAEIERRARMGRKPDLCRSNVNSRVGCVKRFFKWCVSQELIPPAVFHGLQSVDGLKRGRCDARETEPIKPVATEWIEATLPYLLPQVRAMVELQLITGMRPGETCIVRGCDINMTGPVWIYRPEHHKGQWKGKDREVAIGPRGQAILKPWLRLNTTEYLFQPAEAMEWFRQEQRKNRKSRVQPSQFDRKKKKPKRKPGNVYKTLSYNSAIKRGIVRANKARDRQNLLPVPHWHANQLRHTRATEIRRQLGLEAAQVILGHAKADVTQIYAEKNRELATEIAQRLG